MFLGGTVAAAATTAVEKGVSIFRVIKVKLSFGELTIFQMVQNFNRIQLMPYILIVWKKNLKKFKKMQQKRKNEKRQKNTERYRLSAHIHHPPLQNLTLGTIFSKKSPQMPPNPLQGGLVYGNMTKVSFYNLQIPYINGGGGGGENYTF